VRTDEEIVDENYHGSIIGEISMNDWGRISPDLAADILDSIDNGLSTAELSETMGIQIHPV